MKKKYLFKNLFYVLILTALIFSLAACSSSTSGTDTTGAISEEATEDDTSDSENVEKDEAAEEEDRGEAVVEEETNGYGFTQSQMDSLYECIGEAVKTEYLEPNGIAPESFKWPEYEKYDNGFYSEDYAWSYFSSIFTSYCYDGSVYNTDGYGFDMPSEANQQLMNSVLDGIIAWSELPSSKDANGNIYFSDVADSISPSYEVIPANVKFTE